MAMQLKRAGHDDFTIVERSSGVGGTCGAIPGLLVPGGGSTPAVSAQAPAPRLHVELPGVVVVIEECVIAGVRAVSGARVEIRNSIVDAAPHRRLPTRDCSTTTRAHVSDSSTAR